MVQLDTGYMGIPLKNPLIAGASHLTSDMDTIRKLEDAGASAIVTKSLFEEQIELERFKLNDEREQYYYRHPEMITVGAQIEHAGAREHLYWVEKTKKTCTIPVIASLNAIEKKTWVEYAQQLESTGADALELNLYSFLYNQQRSAWDIEQEQLENVQAVLAKVALPVSVKLSAFYTNALHFIAMLDDLGVRGFVLFNRLFQPEIDVDKIVHIFPFYLSQPEDHRLPLRFAGLLDEEIQADICSSTGIYNGKDAVKMILAGASCFQVVSALIRHKPDHIGILLKDIEKWMEDHRMDRISDFRGSMNKTKINDPWVYTRTQYIKWVMRSRELFDPMENIQGE